jgi:hypothetical protein
VTREHGATVLPTILPEQQRQQQQQQQKAVGVVVVADDDRIGRQSTDIAPV